MKHIVLLGVLLIVGTMLNAQKITINDSETDEPIELVNIIGDNINTFAITNAKGQADISMFKSVAKIEIRTIGYLPYITSYDELKTDSFQVALKATNLNIDEVVISANRWQLNSNNIPSKIISISPKTVAIQNPQTAADLLGISGKVFIQKSQQGGGSPMIRGFATNRLLYVVDGVRMNTAIFRSGNIQNVINIDPFAVENTEVLFGPGSVMYGSDAIGGVMNFQTLTPHLSLNDTPLITGNVLTRYSSANQEKTGHFSVNVGWKKWALVTSLSSWNFDNLMQGSHGPDDYLKSYYVQRVDSVDRVFTQQNSKLQIPTAYSQVNFMQKVRFKPNNNWDLQYGFHYSETSEYGRYDRHNRIKNNLPRYAEWNYGPQLWIMHNLLIAHNGNNILYDKMNIHFALQNFEESRIDRSLNKVERNTQTEQVAAYSANSDFIKFLGNRNVLNYGLEYVLNNVKSTGELNNINTGVNTDGPSRYPQSSWQSLGVYLNNQFKATDNLTFQAGIRYNQFILNADFDTTFYPFPFTTINLNKGSLTGSLGSVYRPSETWVISMNLGTAFRSPNVDDLGKVFDSEPGAVTVPNPELQAELAYNIDFSIAKVFGNWLKIDATAYYSYLQHAMVRRNYTFNGADSMMYDGQMSQVQAIQNAANAYVYGIQGGLELKMPNSFSLSSDINYQKGNEELDNGTKSAIRHAAPLFGTSRLIYAYGRLNLHFYANYQAKCSYNNLPDEETGKTEIYAADKDGNPYAPAWYTLNIKAMYQLTRFLAINVGIENLSNQRYRPYSSGISAPGRNFIVSLKANF